MKFKHTAGLWLALPLNHKDLEGQFEIFVGDSEQEYMIAKVFPAKPYIGIEQSKANAKLIAAAPKMIEVLNKLMEVYEKDGQLLNFNVDLARLVIKKATE